MNMPGYAKYEHGQKMDCPVCGASGTYDVMACGQTVFKDSIWWNEHIKGYECVECWDK